MAMKPWRPREPASAVFRGLLGNRNFILLVLYFTLPAIAGWVVRDWMPEILREKFALGQGEQALQNSAAAKGNLFSGNTQEALSNYAQNAAQQDAVDHGLQQIDVEDFQEGLHG